MKKFTEKKIIGVEKVQKMDVTKFPKSLYFFGRISQYKSPMAGLAYILSFFSYLQLATYSLFPVLFEYNRTGKFEMASEVIQKIVCFNSFKSQLFSSSIFVACVFIVTFVIVGSTFIFYCYLTRRGTIPKLILKLRGLLFLYHPTIYLSVSSFITSTQLHDFVDTSKMEVVNICNIAIGIVTVGILLFFQYWAFPLFYTIPFYDSYGLLPEYTALPSTSLLYQKYVIIMTSCMLSFLPFNVLVYSYAISSFLFGINALLTFFKNPYISNFWNACEFSALFTFTLAPSALAVMIPLELDEIYVWIPSVLILIVSFSSYYFYLEKKESFIMRAINDKEISLIKSQNINFLINIVVSNRIYNEEVFEFIKKKYIENGMTIHSQFVDILYYFITGKDARGKIEILNNLTMLSSCEKYTLFVLTKIYTSQLTCDPKELSKVYKLKSDYLNLNNQFWNYRMDGKLEKCFDIIQKMSSVSTKIKTTFWEIKQFYPKSQKLKELDQDFIWKIIYDKNLNLGSHPENYIKSQEVILSERIHKLIPRPPTTIPIIILMILVFTITCIVSNLNNFEIMKDSSLRMEIIDTVNLTLNVGADTVKVNIAINSLVNCTDDGFMDQTEFFDSIYSSREPRGIQLYLISDYINDLINLMDELNALIGASSVQDFDMWLDNNIDFINSKLTVKNILSYYILNAKELYDGRIECYCPMVDFFRSRALNFTTQMREINDHIICYIDQFQENMNSLTFYRSFNEYSLIAAAFTLFLAFINKLKQYHIIYTIIQVHLQTKSHPLNKNKEYSKNDEPFKILPGMFMDLIFTFIFFVAFFIQFLIVMNCLNHYKEKIFDTSNMLITNDNISLMSTSTVNSLISSLSFYNGVLEDRNWDDYNKVAQNFAQLLSRVHLLYSNDQITEIVTDVVDSDLVPRSLHDIYSKWAIMKQNSLFYFFLLTIQNVNSSDYLYVHLQHLFLTHLLPDYYRFSYAFSDLVQQSNTTLMYIIIYEIIVIVLFFLLYTLYAILSTVWHTILVEELSNIISLLDPSYVGRSSSLMNYLVKLDSSPSSGSNDKYTFLRLLSQAGVPIIVTTSNLSICAFTKEVQVTFNYREEQLIGQPLTLLIPKDEKSFKLYNSIKNGESGVSLFAIGVESGRKSLVLDIYVTKLRPDENTLFYMMELTYYEEYDYYEDLTQAHRKYFDEILTSEYPSNALKDSKNLNFILCYLQCQRDSDDADLLQYGLKVSEPKFADALVLYASSSSILLLFIVNEMTYNFCDNAINFLKEYFTNSEQRFGILIDGSDLSTKIFTYPFIDYGRGLQMEEASLITPQPLVDGTAPEFYYLPQLISLAENNLIIISKPFLRHFINDYRPTPMPDIIPGTPLYSVRL